jgi:putative intracellular protease/amidase
VGKKVAILAADGVERVELEQPRGALYGAGAASDLLSIHPGEIEARQFDMVSAGTADLPMFCSAIVEQFAQARTPMRG